MDGRIMSIRIPLGCLYFKTQTTQLLDTSKLKTFHRLTGL